MAWLNHPKPVQVCQDRCINGLDQEKPVIPTQKAYWTRTVVLRSTLQGLLKHEITSLQVKKKFWLFRPSFHVIGKKVCLVMLCKNPGRRDKPWNYIPTEFQRYTKLIPATGKLYGHVENVWGIPFPKRIMEKDQFLGELFQEWVSHCTTTCWLVITKLQVTDIWLRLNNKCRWLLIDCNAERHAKRKKKEKKRDAGLAYYWYKFTGQQPASWLLIYKLNGYLTKLYLTYLTLSVCLTQPTQLYLSLPQPQPT